MKHKIKIDDSEPFKEHFRCILPPLLHEVRQHIDEMLEAGAIRPSCSPWCNTIVLVHKEERGCVSVLTSGNSMLELRKILIHFHAFDTQQFSQSKGVLDA